MGFKDHMIWMIIPKNQTLWKQNKVFAEHMQRLPDGRYYTTVSGGYSNNTWGDSWRSGSTYGKVKMGIGWSSDMDVAASGYKAGLGFKANTGDHEDKSIAAMLEGAQNFEDHRVNGYNFDYTPDPDHFAGHNSNSVFTGIGAHAGIPLPDLPRAPGAAEPIPNDAFTALHPNTGSAANGCNQATRLSCQ
jgi:hypothetical protein